MMNHMATRMLAFLRYLVHFSQKEFKQAAHDPDKVVAIAVDTPKEFLDEIWNNCCSMLQREILFTADETGLRTPNYAEKMLPDRDDLPRYVLLYTDSARSSIRCEQSALSPRMMQGWRDRTIKAYVHIYFLGIRCKDDFTTVKSQLLDTIQRDRSGAPSITVKNQVADSLYDLHKDHLSASRAAWLCWATYISSSPANQRDNLMSEFPPPEYMRLFQTVPTPPEVTLQALRRSLQVASTVNEGYQNEIRQCREASDFLFVCAQNLQKPV